MSDLAYPAAVAAYNALGARRLPWVLRWPATALVACGVFVPLLTLEIAVLMAGLLAWLVKSWVEDRVKAWRKRRQPEGAEPAHHSPGERVREVVRRPVPWAGRTVLEELFWVDLDIGSTVMARTRRPGMKTRAVCLLIHGLMQNYSSFHIPSLSLADYLANQGYDVFCLDLRGSKRSLKAGAVPANGFHCFVESDVPNALNVIESITGERSVFLIGHSMGSAVSCSVAGLYPDRVRGVVSIAGLYSLVSGTYILHHACLFVAKLLEKSGLPRHWMLPTAILGRIFYETRAITDSKIFKLSPVHAWTPGGGMEQFILRDFLLHTFEGTSVGILCDLCGMAGGKGFCDAKGKSYFDAFESREDLALLVIAGTKDLLVSAEDSLLCYHRSKSHDKAYRLFSDENYQGGGGHIDLIMGRDAPTKCWPLISSFLDKRCGVEPEPSASASSPVGGDSG